MSNPQLSEEKYREAKSLLQQYGTFTLAAQYSGIPASTLKHRVIRGDQLFAAPAHGFIPPDLPKEEIDKEALVAHLTKRNRERKEAKKAKQWMEFKLNSPGPYALVFIGDPHLGDNGCNLELIQQHMALIKSHKNMFAVGMGDYINNWCGNLRRIYEWQEATRPHEHLLMEWFLEELEDKLLLIIRGNHDIWSKSHGHGDVMEWMHQGAAPIVDWSCRFQVTSPNKHIAKIWAAHDFPGHSMWHNVHGNMKRAKFTGGEADIYISGDKHCWTIMETEDEWTGRVYWLARARGYKEQDDHAHKLGYGDQSLGHSITAVIDPLEASVPRQKKLFSDVAEAADYLKYKQRANKQ